MTARKAGGKAGNSQREAVKIALGADLPYAGLRGFETDERLFAYLPLEAARQERLLPLALVGDTLRLASSRDDPELSAIADRFPNLEIALVIAPQDELDALLDAEASK